MPEVNQPGWRKEKTMLIDQQTWETPALTVYGDIVELTLVKDKHAGVTDGFTFNGVPISG